MRNRFKAVALAGDFKQAFLQIRIREEDIDSLRFHWIRDKDLKIIEVFRFTRALFGLVQSPFLLSGTLEQHLERCEEEQPSLKPLTEEVRHSLYVEDLISGGNTQEEAQNLKESAMSVFQEPKFKLHKWHLNVPELETVGNVSEEQQESNAKEQLGVKAGETKILGMVWNKTDDTLGVTFPEPCEQVTKRRILRSLASVFDPLGMVSPVTPTGKLIYRDACDQKLPWDTQLPENLLKRWRKCERELPEITVVPRSLSCFREPIEAIDVHSFGDASGVGVSTAVYAVVHQKSGVNQGLIAANSRLVKKNLTMLRLELVSAHMAANLAMNATDALKGYPVRSVNGWTDSTVALRWIRGKGNYKQFVTTGL